MDPPNFELIQEDGRGIICNGARVTTGDADALVGGVATGPSLHMHGQTGEVRGRGAGRTNIQNAMVAIRLPIGTVL